MGVKCLAQEHNTMTRAGLEPGPIDPESSALTMRPPRLPLILKLLKENLKHVMGVLVLTLSCEKYSVVL